MSCCPSGQTKAQSTSSGDDTHADVSEYYSQTIQKTTDLKTSACCIGGEDTKHVRKCLQNVHEEILSKFYGCGSPLPFCLENCTVLDLGCGTGRDVYVAAQLVGQNGRVIGVDMTAEQLEVARKHESWHQEKFGFPASNVVFQQGVIEDLRAAGIEDNSVDVVISNCVLNLAPDKEPVLREIWRVLRPGGELYFSDIYANKRIPSELMKDKELLGECLSGALYTRDFERLMRRVGFNDSRLVTSREVFLSSDVSNRLSGTRFFSRTIRAFKLVELEETCENYSQSATYLGTIPQCPHAFRLDAATQLVTATRTPVDGNTAAMLQRTRLAPHFRVTPARQHAGPFLLHPSLHGPLAADPTFLTEFAQPSSSTAECCAPVETNEKSGNSCCSGQKSCAQTSSSCCPK